MNDRMTAAIAKGVPGFSEDEPVALIPRAQYEALMAAAKVLDQLADTCKGQEDWDAVSEALLALQAAGIKTEDTP